MTRHTLNHLEGGEHRTTGFREVEHHPVAEPLDRLPPVLLGGPSHKGGQPRRQIRGGLIPPLLGQSRVSGDVEEAHRRRTVEPTEQTRLLQDAFDLLDETLAPGVFLMPVVDGEEGLLDKGSHPGPEVALSVQHLALGHAPLEEWLLDLGAPQVRLRVGDPAQTIRADTEPSLDNSGPEPLRELKLDRRHDRQLVLADVVLRPWLCEADRLADHLQEVHGDARPGAQLVEGHVAEPGEPIECGHIQEGEGQGSLLDRGAHSIDRHPSPLPALHPTRPEHVTRRELVSGARLEDPELDQPADVVGVDPGPLGDLLPGVPAHDSASIDACLASSAGHCSRGEAHGRRRESVAGCLMMTSRFALRSVRTTATREQAQPRLSGSHTGQRGPRSLSCFMAASRNRTIPLWARRIVSPAQGRRTTGRRPWPIGCSGTLARPWSSTPSTSGSGWGCTGRSRNEARPP